MYIEYYKKHKNELVLVRRKNINSLGEFLMDQTYAFPVNDSVDGGSVTVHRCSIKKGVKVEDGYDAVRAFLEHLGLCPVGVCLSMGFPEVVGVASPT
jgi:hypothetical protein